ncbi:MAG TPA: methyltransferase domain-containing protein [Albitalea sp.]|jgi:malonyl-CoA O-methyltransferase|nr:methyltransferase domain-containing protein [Albitalea sp.]
MAETDSSDARRLDDTAARAVLRRLARSSEAPWLHGEVARRMAERLALIRLQPHRIIEWWSFLGASDTLLREAYPKAQIVAVEPNAGFAERSRRSHRAPWWSPRRLRAPAAAVVTEDDELGGSAQLVWANMMLHAVKNPPALMTRWQRALSADGFVMFSCLGPDSLRELRALYARLGWPAPAPPFVDMHDLGDMLVHAGFADPVMDQETLHLSWQTPQALLAELRSLGGNLSPQRAAGLRTPRWKARLEQELHSLAGADGRLSMTFEIAYGHAFKALPRAQQGEPTTVSLDDMRALVRSGRRP